MAYKLEKIEGVGPAYAAKLAAAGIGDTAVLLEKAGTAKGRKTLAEATGIAEKLILNFVNRADLMRVPGIGEQFADLLEAAGVDTVKELATRNPVNLTEALAATNEARKLTRAVPAEAVVARWVEAAKSMPPAVSH